MTMIRVLGAVQLHVHVHVGSTARHHCLYSCYFTSMLYSLAFTFKHLSPAVLKRAGP